MNKVRRIFAVLAIACVTIQVLSLLLGVEGRHGGPKHSYSFAVDRLKFSVIRFTHSRTNDNLGPRVEFFSYGEEMPLWLQENHAFGFWYANGGRMFEASVPHWFPIILMVLGFVATGGIRNIGRDIEPQNEKDAADVPQTE